MTLRNLLLSHLHSEIHPDKLGSCLKKVKLSKIQKYRRKKLIRRYKKSAFLVPKSYWYDITKNDERGWRTMRPPPFLYYPISLAEHGVACTTQLSVTLIGCRTIDLLIPQPRRSSIRIFNDLTTHHLLFCQVVLCTFCHTSSFPVIKSQKTLKIKSVFLWLKFITI